MHQQINNKLFLQVEFMEWWKKKNVKAAENFDEPQQIMKISEMANGVWVLLFPALWAETSLNGH